MQRPRGRQFLPVRPEEEHRINRHIRAPQVRLIGAEGEQLGVVAIEEAIRLAQAAEVDLVEVAPTADPPVCRLMDYGKFRYSKQKKDAEAKKKQHVTELKELRIRPGTDEHDLERQLKKAEEFLTDGQRVKFTLRFRGREMAHQSLGREKLLRVANKLGEISWIELEPRTEGRIMNLVLAPGARKKPGALPTGRPAPGPGGSASTGAATAPRPAPSPAAKPAAESTPPPPRPDSTPS